MSVFVYIFFGLILAFFWIRWLGEVPSELKHWIQKKINRKKELNWIDEKMAYASCLIGITPSPPQEFFLEPNTEFYSKCVFSTETLQEVVELICKKIKYTGPELYARFSNFVSERPAHILGTTIEISQKYERKGESIGAILAHEVTHAYLNERKAILSQNLEGELLTDLVAMHLGLGKLILNGMETSRDVYKTPWGDRLVEISKSHFGYFSYFSFAYAFQKVRRHRSIKMCFALRNLPLSSKILLLRASLTITCRQFLKKVGIY